MNKHNLARDLRGIADVAQRPPRPKAKQSKSKSKRRRSEHTYIPDAEEANGPSPSSNQGALGGGLLLPIQRRPVIARRPPPGKVEKVARSPESRRQKGCWGPHVTSGRSPTCSWTASQCIAPGQGDNVRLGPSKTTDHRKQHCHTSTRQRLLLCSVDQRAR
jgi:hypothetical protein